MSAELNNLSGLAADSQSLDALRAQARLSPDKALAQAAKQFEAVFMNMLMKSMRDATPQDGMFDNDQTKLFTSMLDQQLAQNVGGSHGMGLADMMVKQLSRYTNKPEQLAQVQVQSSKADTTAAPLTNRTNPDNSLELNPLQLPLVKGRAQSAPPLTRGGWEGFESSEKLQSGSVLPSAYNENVQQGFVQLMLPHATVASRESGIPAHQMIGQAALESGWGRREIKMADGSNSYNLFGIKAGADWKGKVVESRTTEYINGVLSKPVEKFRAYDSYADSFLDYAKLMTHNPRYAKVLEQGDSAQGFARALQNAGYATDPKYADKLVQVIGKVNTLA